jgi:hypothetical protein
MDYHTPIAVSLYAASDITSVASSVLSDMFVLFMPG